MSTSPSKRVNGASYRPSSPISYLSPIASPSCDGCAARGGKRGVAMGDWVSFACMVAGRDLTKAEWRDLLPDRPYQHVCPT